MLTPYTAGKHRKIQLNDCRWRAWNQGGGGGGRFSKDTCTLTQRTRQTPARITIKKQDPNSPSIHTAYQGFHNARIPHTKDFTKRTDAPSHTNRSHSDLIKQDHILVLLRKDKALFASYQCLPPTPSRSTSCSPSPRTNIPNPDSRIWA